METLWFSFDDPPTCPQESSDVLNQDTKHECEASSSILSFIPDGEPFTLKSLGISVGQADELKWPTRQLHETPETGSWTLPMLYKKNQCGKKMYWQIGYDESTNERVTIYGHVGSLPTFSRREVEPKGKNTAQAQAWQDAHKKYRDKCDDGYSISGDSSSGRLAAQLAPNKCYQNPNFNPKDMSTSRMNFPVMISPKLDGIRGRVFIEDGEVRLYSRTEKILAEVNCGNHRVEWRKFMSYLPPGLALDGELYTQDFEFQQITSIINKDKTYDERIEKVQLWIFDLVIPETCSYERYRLLCNAWNQFRQDGFEGKYIRIVEQNLVYNHDEIIQRHDLYVSQGYEGAMIRHLVSVNPRQPKKGYYQGGRNVSWMKVKKFQDSEFVVINVEEAKGEDRGTAIFVLRLPNGSSFNCRPGGTRDERRRYFEHPKECIGRIYTVKYFGLTDDGKPRFPVGKGFRDFGI